MIIKQVVVGMLRTNCYILGDEESRLCAIIDPGANADRIMEAVGELGLRPELILLTHGHYDHVMAAPELVRRTGARLYISKADQWQLDTQEVLRYGTRKEHYTVPHVDGFLDEGTELTLGSLKIQVLHTPGHTGGCCTLLCQDAMFSGDTLFQDCCGRTDLETGSEADMMNSLRRLGQLAGNYRVFPGHEGLTSLEYERANNPYLREAMRR